MNDATFCEVALQQERTSSPHRWLPWLPAVLALPWWLAGAYLVPPLIRQAYAGTSHPLLNGLISGQAVHIVDRYLHYWEYLVWLSVIALLMATAAAVLAEQVGREEWLTPRRAWLITLGVVTPAALCLRLLHLTSKSLSFDESYSVALAQAPWDAFFEATAAENRIGIFYYILLRVAAVFGESEWMMRGLSVVIGVATIPVLYLLGKKLYGPSCGLLASVLIAVQGFHIEWSQKARPYALATLLAALSTLVFIRAVERPTKKAWTGYAILILLGVYTHIIFLFLILAHLVSLLFLRPRDIPWSHLLISNAVIGVLGVLPEFLWSFAAAERMVYLDLFTWPGFLRALKSFAGKGGELLLGLQLILVIVAIGLAFRAWRSCWGSPASWRWALVISWFSVPLCLIAFLSTAMPLLVARALLPFLPGLILLCGFVLILLRPRILAVAAFALLVTLSVDGVLTHYERHGIEEWRWAVEQFARDAEPTDAVVIFHPSRYLAFSYYVRRVIGPLDSVTVHFPPADQQVVVLQESAYRMEIPPDLGARLAEQHPRVWVVLSHDDTPRLGREVYRDELLRQVQELFELSERYYFPMDRLSLFVRVDQE